MKLFDFLKEAQEKAEAFQKKAESVTEQIKNEPLATLSVMIKPKEKQPKPNKSKSLKDKPTEKGIDAISKHKEVIANHATKPDRSIEGITKQILAARDNIVKNGYEHYEFIANRVCCDVCARLNGKHFPVYKLKIGVNAPPMHEGCRCSIAAWVDDKEFEAWINSL